ncbi:MAG: hypothetical protein ABR590_11720 [Spirochaetia bacterium]
MEEQAIDWVGNLKELGPWILGFIALVQVWIIAAWKQLRKGSIEIYESGSIEIGYGDLGPSVALLGTLRCLEKDVFVKSMDVEIVRMKDGARHLFRWYAFRPHELSLGGQSQPKLEIAGSFLATPTQPNKYNIFFTESAFIAEFRPKVKPFLDRWHAYVRERFEETGEDTMRRAVEVLGNTQLTQNLFKDFSDKGNVVEAYSLLDRAFYWHEGRYRITLKVDAAKPERSFTKVWSFALTQDDSERLRLNTVGILQSLCGIQVTFNFAYPEYGSA